MSEWGKYGWGSSFTCGCGHVVAACARRWMRDRDPGGLRCVLCGPPETTEQPKPARWDDGLALPWEVAPGMWLLTINDYGNDFKLFRFSAGVFNNGDARIHPLRVRVGKLDAMSRDAFRAWLRAEAEKLAPKQETVDAGAFVVDLDAQSHFFDADAGPATDWRHATLVPRRHGKVPSYTATWTDEAKSWAAGELNAALDEIASRPLYSKRAAYRDGMRQLVTMARGLSALCRDLDDALYAGSVSDIQKKHGGDRAARYSMPDRLHEMRAIYMRHQLAELQAKRQREEAGRIGWDPELIEVDEW